MSQMFVSDLVKPNSFKGLILFLSWLIQSEINLRNDPIYHPGEQSYNVFVCVCVCVCVRARALRARVFCLSGCLDVKTKRDWCPATIFYRYIASRVSYVSYIYDIIDDIVGYKKRLRYRFWFEKSSEVENRNRFREFKIHVMYLIASI